MEGNSVIGMAGGFVALAIMLGIGTSILGGGGIQDCVNLPGAPTYGPAAPGPAVAGNAATSNDPAAYTSTSSTYVEAGSSYTASTNSDVYASGKTASDAKGLAGSWAHTCAENSSRAQSGYTLLLVALVIMAAAIVLIVVRMLTG